MPVGAGAGRLIRNPPAEGLLAASGGGRTVAGAVAGACGTGGIGLASVPDKMPLAAAVPSAPQAGQLTLNGI